MQPKRLLHRGALCLACIALALGGCESRVERLPSAVEPTVGDRPDADGPAVPGQPGDIRFETVTAHVDFPVSYELSIQRPGEAITTGADAYYITGTSDPDQPLRMNGETVEARGEFGSFGVYVDLEEGDNLFVFEQDTDSADVLITKKEEDDGEPPTTGVLSRMRPEFDAAALPAAEYTLSCVGPSGARVTARVGEQAVALEQLAATDVEGVPATFSAAFTPALTDDTVDYGPVVYELEYGGETEEYQSYGSLFVGGAQSPLLVRAIDTCATAFDTESDEGGFFTTLLEGVVDSVEEVGGSMYRLGMGGWVFKDAVQPLAPNPASFNRVSSATHTVEDGRDLIRITGSAAVPYRAQWGGEAYSIELFHTAGIEEIPLTGSSLLRSIEVLEGEDGTQLIFQPVDDSRMGGYLVQYDDNAITILVRPRPIAPDGGKPLAGVTVAVDPGHGGSDAGAPGVLLAAGPSEKEINYATARAVRSYLEGLGASVIFTREEDGTVDMNTRLQAIRDPAVDFSVSLHSNSIGAALDGTRPSGVEIYYYEAGSQDFADTLQEHIIRSTGRVDRGTKQDYYKITLNSSAPSVMVEMGFLSNPVEYDRMCSKQGIYEMAEAIGEGIAAFLQK